MEFTQETLMQAQILEQQHNESQERLNFIEQNISELEKFRESIDQIKSSNQREMLSSLGKGVFVKTSLIDNDFLVDVGAGVIVKKSAQEITETILDQIAKLKEARIRTLGQLEICKRNLESFLEEVEKTRNAN